MRRESQFRGGTDPVTEREWHVTETGSGSVSPSTDGLRLTIPPTAGRAYSNAQISDYYRIDGRRARFEFVWRPPLRMQVTARAEVEGTAVDALRGTAGFGFWNHPFSPDVSALPRLPRTLWFFFGSPPNDMALAYGVAGHGWKAATMDATRPRALALAPFALPSVLLMRLPGLYRLLWPRIQRALRIGEHTLNMGLLAASHTYEIEWRQEGARFAIDGETVLQTPFAPRGAMGFVAWLDNQYAIVTPQGRVGFGVVPVPREQTLVVEHIVIESL